MTERPQTVSLISWTRPRRLRTRRGHGISQPGEGEVAKGSISGVEGWAGGEGMEQEGPTPLLGGVLQSKPRGEARVLSHG